MVNPDRNLYEPPYDDALLYESDLEPERPRSRPLVVLLGIVVLAAFAGVVWVAYNQGVKQGQGGSPPILTADSGPTRVAADPSATAQVNNPAPDKSYDRLFGDASEQTDNLLPPAEQPRTAPAPQDVASSAAAPATPEQGAGGPSALKATDIAPPVDPRIDSATGIAGAPEITSAPQAPNAASAGLSGTGREDITAALPPVESVTPPSAAPRAITAPTALAPKTVAAPKPLTVVQTTPAAPKPSVVKLTPPAPVAEAVQPSEQDVASLSSPTDAAPVSTPPVSGSVMIQLGSFPNDKLAASAWSKIKSSNQDLLGEYKPIIKAAEIDGKGTWYRLRVGGFSDKSAAQGVCEQLKASGQACIIASK